tara:strand:- start:515 stop:652 length:138 start_codon:yes stop_codon:yes gene_type:complete
MAINCKTNKYKDISVNGSESVSPRWEEPNRDKLIIKVISVSCKNA